MKLEITKNEIEMAKHNLEVNQKIANERGNGLKQTLEYCIMWNDDIFDDGDSVPERIELLKESYLLDAIYSNGVGIFDVYYKQEIAAQPKRVCLAGLDVGVKKQRQAILSLIKSKSIESDIFHLKSEKLIKQGNEQAIDFANSDMQTFCDCICVDDKTFYFLAKINKKHRLGFKTPSVTVPDTKIMDFIYVACNDSNGPDSSDLLTIYTCTNAVIYEDVERFWQPAPCFVNLFEDDESAA